MIFLSLVVVLGLLYWAGSVSFIQQDGWFRMLALRLQNIPGISSVHGLPLALALLIPLLVLVALILVVAQTAGKNALFFLYVPVLLYSIGRGNFIVDVKTYLDYVARGDIAAASEWLIKMRGQTQTESADSLVVITDWQTLHTQALKVIGYRGFERAFAVIFWFVIAGPVGALLYRLSVLYRELSPEAGNEARMAAKWLWLLEFPAVRLMGVTWAFVGNFETCPLRESLLDTESSSARVLNQCLRGALGAPTEFSNSRMTTLSDAQQLHEEALREEESQDIIEDLTGDVITTHSEPAYSHALVKSSLPLYTRSLLFWVCSIAFATLFI